MAFRHRGAQSSLQTVSSLSGRSVPNYCTKRAIIPAYTLTSDKPAMTQREELVNLIANGSTPEQIFRHFRLLGKHRSAVLDLLHQSGVSLPIPPSEDDIT